MTEWMGHCSGCSFPGISTSPKALIDMCCAAPIRSEAAGVTRITTNHNNEASIPLLISKSAAA